MVANMFVFNLKPFKSKYKTLISKLLRTSLVWSGNDA